MSSGLEQIRQRCQQIDLAAVLGQAPQLGLFKAELMLDHTEGMLDLGADMSFCRLDQILHPPIRGVRKSPARAGLYRRSELRSLASHLWSLGDALVSGAAVHDSDH